MKFSQSRLKFSILTFRETKDTVRVSFQEYLVTGFSKVTSCGFWAEKTTDIGPPGVGLNSAPGTYLNSTLGFAYFRTPHKKLAFGGWLAWNFQSRLKIQSRRAILNFFNLWALRGTELRWQKEHPKRRFSQIHPFSWKSQHVEGAGNRRFSQETEGFSQIENFNPGGRSWNCSISGPLGMVEVDVFYSLANPGKWGARRTSPKFTPSFTTPLSQGPLMGGVFKRGCFPIWTCPSFLSFFVLFGTFPIFPGFSRFARGMVRGFSRFVPFPLSRPNKSPYEEQSRKGPRHNLDLSRKKWETPGLETPGFSFSQLSCWFSGRGCDEARFSEKKRFQWKGGRQFSEWGLGKDLYRKGNSVKRSGRFSELPDSENWKLAVLIPVPKIGSYFRGKMKKI